MRVLLNFTDKGKTVENALQKLAQDVEVQRIITTRQLLSSIIGPEIIDVIVVRKVSECFEDDLQLLIKIRDNKQEHSRIVYLRADYEHLNQAQHEQLYRNGLYGLYYLSGGDAALEAAKDILEDRTLAQTRVYYGLTQFSEPVSAKQAFSVATLESAKIAMEYLLDSYTGTSLEKRYEEIIQSIPTQEQKVDFTLTLPDYIKMELDGSTLFDHLAKEHKKRFFGRYLPKLSGKFPHLEDETYLEVADKFLDKSRITKINEPVRAQVEMRERIGIERQEELKKEQEECTLEWVIKEEATCEKEGVRVCTKTKGSDTFTQEESVAALGHLKGTWEVTCKPTCTESGKRICSCTRCQKVLDEEDMQPLGHRLGEWQTIEEATCTAPGKKMRKCLREGCDFKETALINALGHQYGCEISVAPTCNEMGGVYRVCEKCGQKEYKKKRPATNQHEFGATVILKEATCFEEGLTGFSCKVCGVQRIKSIIPATGRHRMSDWVMIKEPKDHDNGIKERHCLTNGCSYKEEQEVVPHIPEPVTQTEKETVKSEMLEQCFLNKTALSKEKQEPCEKAHEYGAWVQIQPPTCTSSGKQQKTCIHCGEVVVEDIPQKEHVLSAWVVALKASCGVPGKLERHCMNDGCEYKEIKERPAIRHEYGEWKTIQEATCMAPGKASRTCKLCAHMEEKDLPKAQHVLSDWNILKESMCTEAGIREHHCLVKGCKYQETEEIRETGHQYGQPFVFLQATCRENGKIARKCAVCGDVQVIQETPKGPHQYGDPVVIKSAGCQKKGKIKQRCVFCDQERIKEEHACGHEYQKNDEGVYVCLRCGRKKGDKKRIIAVVCVVVAAGIVIVLLSRALKEDVSEMAETQTLIAFEGTVAKTEQSPSKDMMQEVSTDETQMILQIDEETAVSGESSIIEETEKDTMTQEPTQESQEQTTPEETSPIQETTQPETAALETTALETTSVSTPTTSPQTTPAPEITQTQTVPIETVPAQTTAQPKPTEAPTTQIPSTACPESIEDFNYMVGDIFTGEEVNAFIRAHDVTVLVITRDGQKHTYSGGGDTSVIASDASFSCNMGSSSIVFSQF